MEKASKNIQFILKKLKINYKIVSRNSSFDYSDINENFINTVDIIINTTPLGTYPKSIPPLISHIVF